MFLYSINVNDTFININRSGTTIHFAMFPYRINKMTLLLLTIRQFILPNTFTIIKNTYQLVTVKEKEVLEKVMTSGKGINNLMYIYN